LGKDPIVVYGSQAKKGVPTLFSYASANQGVEVYLDGVHKGMLPKGITVAPGAYKVVCKYDGRTIFNERIKVEPGNDYMLPYFKEMKYEEEDKTFILVNGGYRKFFPGDVDEELLPNSPILGFSIHRHDVITKWLGLSGGFDYGKSGDLEQYAPRVGVKVTVPVGGTRFFIGPDFMFMFFRYTADTIADKKVPSDMSFFCPGAETILSYKFDMGLVMALGASAYYLPYELDGVINNISFAQGFAGLGYAF